MAINLTALNHTHHPATKSWVESANAPTCDFPVQNLPLAVFRRRGKSEAFRGGVAIGDQVIDLAAVSESGVMNGLAALVVKTCAQPTLNEFFATGPVAWRALRHSLFALLELGASPAQMAALRNCFVPMVDCEFTVPTQIGDYTDFYTSIHHALNVGKIARPDAPLTPNFQWLPIAYHGRASSIVISGTKFRRPMGQSIPPGASAPVFGPCTRLDYELELGLFIGTGNAMGKTIPLSQADAHMFGVCLLNDWSARDIQFWEMAPLGPFLGKNFCTSISPWIVTMEALAPYRSTFNRPANQPQPLAYLDSSHNRAAGALDISLQVLIETAQSRTQGVGAMQVSRTNFHHQYWTFAQMVTQHTVGGCNLNSGDLLGSGTISGPAPSEAGAIIELTKGGKEPITLSNGEQRAFLQDGDAVILRGWCEKPGCARIGFGENRGEVLPALITH
jgi:fumarylacetoacetase